MDITTIPRTQLRKDRKRALGQIAACEKALAKGVTHFAGGLSVQYRLEEQQKFLATVETELARREALTGTKDTPEE